MDFTLPVVVQAREDGWTSSDLARFATSFLKMMESPRYEDFEIEYWNANMWAFMGNGFEVREFDGRDITDYLGNLDEEGRDVQPDYDEGLKNILGGFTLGEEYVVKGG